MILDNRTIALVAVGAAVAANCHPCLENTSARARAAGLSDLEIRAAAEVANAVKEGAANSMDKQIAKLTGQTAPPAAGCESGCGCK